VTTRVDAGAAVAAIHCLRLPLPRAGTSVNAYLVDDDPLTLVDTGLGSVSTLHALEDALAALGRSLEEIELVVVTHHHADHVGLAAAIVRRSGARVAAWHGAVGALADPAAQADADYAYVEELLLLHGVERAVAVAMRQLLTLAHLLGGDGVRVDRPLADGDTIALAARQLRVLHRPGHSQSDLVLVDDAAGVMLSGDHLLRRPAANALAARPLGDAAGSPLLAFRTSLRATLELAARVALPGHGAPLTDWREVAQARLEEQEAQAAELLRLVREAPGGVYELALRQFGAFAAEQPYHAVSEVLGHLDLLGDAVVVRGGKVAAA
jgi:glyoxylase-like metal-dependent hydrolase (beta-lactamase superfamily II)